MNKEPQEQLLAPNKGKRFTEEEKRQLDEIAEQIQDVRQLNEIDRELAQRFGRTIGSIRKQIEQRKGWYYTEGDKVGRMVEREGLEREADE